jgi:Cft2 family RNA processing exonuclease
LSTAIHIIKTSRRPVATRHIKNFTSSGKSVVIANDLLSKTQSLLVMKANKTAKSHAITVDGTFEIPRTK